MYPASRADPLPHPPSCTIPTARLWPCPTSARGPACYAFLGEARGPALWERTTGPPPCPCTGSCHALAAWPPVHTQLPCSCCMAHPASAWLKTWPADDDHPMWNPDLFPAPWWMCTDCMAGFAPAALSQEPGAATAAAHRRGCSGAASASLSGYGDPLHKTHPTQRTGPFRGLLRPFNACLCLDRNTFISG